MAAYVWRCPRKTCQRLHRTRFALKYPPQCSHGKGADQVDMEYIGVEE